MTQTLASWLGRFLHGEPAEGRKAEIPSIGPDHEQSDGTAAPKASREGSKEDTGESMPYVQAATIDDILRIEEVSDAEFFIGDLFRRRFHCDPPNYPRSFVAFYQAVRGRLEPVGFVHYLVHDDSYLCGEI